MVKIFTKKGRNEEEGKKKGEKKMLKRSSV